jgi:quercetin dioxygenase-like cupin family protein
MVRIAEEHSVLKRPLVRRVLWDTSYDGRQGAWRMQVFRFDPEVAWPVTDYGSSFRLSRLLWARAGEVRVDCLFLEPGDRVGSHPAGLPQLFCVVAGEGWVQSAGTENVSISPGRAAFWTAGEEHAAGTDVGMTAIVVQAEALDPTALLSLV